MFVSVHFCGTAGILANYRAVPVWCFPPTGRAMGLERATSCHRLLILEVGIREPGRRGIKDARQRGALCASMSHGQYVLSRLPHQFAPQYSRAGSGPTLLRGLWRIAEQGFGGGGLSSVLRTRCHRWPEYRWRAGILSEDLPKPTREVRGVASSAFTGGICRECRMSDPVQ